MEAILATEIISVLVKKNKCLRNIFKRIHLAFSCRSRCGLNDIEADIITNNMEQIIASIVVKILADKEEEKRTELRTIEI
jgi:hypothetical protein